MPESDSGQDVPATFLSTMYGLIVRYGGRIERRSGEDVLVVFGRTSTRESAPELATRAALETRDAARRLGFSLAAGVSSGMIVVASGGGGSAERVSGSAITEAMRLAKSAEGGEILVAESTYRSTRSAVRYSISRHSSQGLPRYRVESLLEEPRKARGIEGLRSPFVGREGESRLLCEALERTLAGDSCIVTVVGEAGVGKSRLVNEARHAVGAADGGPPLWLEGRCLELGVAAGYWPFIDMLRQFFAWRSEDDDPSRRERISAALQDLAEGGTLEVGRLDELVHYLGILLSIEGPPEGNEPVGSQDPQIVRAGIFAAVRDLFLALAGSRPVFLVFEDLHWADALSLDLISFLMDVPAVSSGSPVRRLALICVYRPRQHHHCRHLATIALGKCPEKYTEIVLRELTPGQSAKLIDESIDTRAIPAGLRDVVLQRAQGNPFFLEELVRSLIESGMFSGHGHIRSNGASKASEKVPQSVESVIRGKTDQLPAVVRRVLRSAAVLGRVFNQAVLTRMMSSAEGLDDQLHVLEDRALIYEERSLPVREYSFRHVLTRDAVYGGIPDDECRELHELAAEAIRELYGDRPEPYLEQLAHHYEAAGLEEQAVHYLHEAGLKAVRASDNEAAIGLLERALETVRGWPRGSERARTELDLLVALGVPVTATTGYGSAETRRVYQRATDLFTADERSKPAFAATYGLWRYHVLRGELARGMELAEQLSALARDLDEETMRLEANRAMGVTHLHRGALLEAHESLAAGIEAYDPHRHRANAFVYGHDPATSLFSYQAIGLWIRGYPDRAVAIIEELRRHMSDSTHRLSLAYTNAMAGLIYQLCGDFRRARELSANAIDIAEEGHLLMFRVMALATLGWIMVREGRVEEGIARLEETLAWWESVGGGAFRPYYRALLGQALQKRGDLEGASRVLDAAVREIEAGGERLWEPDVYRVRGELHLDAGATAVGEEFLQRALTVAGAGCALSLELRAAVSLARLHGSGGKPTVGGRILEEVLSRFSEGFATADLKAAGALLRELTRTRSADG
jgi:adenylate cyclase